MYEGPAIAKQQPVINDNVRIIHTCTTCVATSIPNVNAASPATICVLIKSFRRSIRSAKTPPANVSSNPGAVDMNPSKPSQNGESVNCKTSQPCATACIHVPVLERNAPDQNNRKLRCRSARNISPTPRLRLCSSSSSVGMIKLIPLVRCSRQCGTDLSL